MSGTTKGHISMLRIYGPGDGFSPGMQYVATKIEHSVQLTRPFYMLDTKSKQGISGIREEDEN